MHVLRRKRKSIKQLRERNLSNVSEGWMASLFEFEISFIYKLYQNKYICNLKTKTIKHCFFKIQLIFKFSFVTLRAIFLEFFLQHHKQGNRTVGCLTGRVPSVFSLPHAIYVLCDVVFKENLTANYLNCTLD